MSVYRHGKANRLSKTHSASTPELTVFWQVTISSEILIDENVRNKILSYTELHPYSRGHICDVEFIEFVLYDSW